MSIELQNFSIGFQEKSLIENISVTFSQNLLTALIGRNGSGKSTLLKTLCRLNQNYKGEIFIDGKNINQISSVELSHKIAYVNTQRPRIGNLKCIDVVSLGRSPYTGWHGKLSTSDYTYVDHALEMVGMSEYKNRYFNTLSDGESQKIMIARAIAQDTDIIILDEPTSFLDLPTRFEVAFLLSSLAHENNKTIIFSTHELDIALEICDMISLLESNTLHNLSVNEMIKSGLIQKLFGTSNPYLDRYLKILLK